ncbi:MAG: tetratricopeptide repeat protein [Planctomycetota bacterium]
MRLLSRLGTAWRKVLAEFRLRRGIWHFQKGHLTRAASLIHLSVIHGGGTFAAHVYLGRIYLRLNRLERARQEFNRARQLDPARFSTHASQENLLVEMARRIQVCQPVPGQTLRRRRVVRDDFSSAEERQRFKVLPPIQIEELDEVDWDDTSGLFDGQGSSPE